MPDQVPRTTHFRAKPRPGRRVDLNFQVDDGATGKPGPSLPAHTLNIGVGGAFIVTRDPPPPGTGLTVSLALPTGTKIAIRAEVRWLQDGDEDRVVGMGVQFRGLAPGELRALNEYFAQLSPDVGSSGLA